MSEYICSLTLSTRRPQARWPDHRGRGHRALLQDPSLGDQPQPDPVASDQSQPEPGTTDVPTGEAGSGAEVTGTGVATDPSSVSVGIFTSDGPAAA